MIMKTILIAVIIILIAILQIIVKNVFLSSKMKIKNVLFLDHAELFPISTKKTTDKEKEAIEFVKVQ